MRLGGLGAAGPGDTPGGLGGTGGAAPVTSGQHYRTEFIVVFVWQEPTPSDALRGEAGTPAK
jgi:hypothetical protein